MTANSEIQLAFDTILRDSNTGYQIAWPGFNFTPPDTGVWLEVMHMPNRGVDDRLANDGYVSPQGIYQVMVLSRPQDEVTFREAEESVRSVFPKGTSVIDAIRVTRHPFSTSVQYLNDRMMLAITIEYSE